MMEADRTPPVHPDLVAWLTRVYPDRCPDPNVADREIWIAVGAQQIIRTIKRLSEKQNTTVLAPPR